MRAAEEAIWAGDDGLERSPQDAETTQISEKRAAQSDVIGAENRVGGEPDDPGLLTLIAAWPALRSDTKAGVLALVNREAGDAE